ncbi:NCS1 nucleoside transporter-like protein [Corynebacterium glyciniphilum AJ 3170]|uniref:NCS1 nucleoside transporter-like protein n=1 Tax=Corynebacterium glyciniphilum AJ 3170 TaxID=1404245 RepID=X5DTW0_9CORY|nr:NCS1 family nucleobase:cation symporter-1 [Corynebacterium glyciniphilum]AHW64709.1 NCS1 nucleoside transporter-like protein [Corynebacterium glyciniphilum AJ 3170]
MRDTDDPATSITDIDVTTADPALFNADLAPIAKKHRKWGAFEIFNVWTNDVQSLAGYTLAASLFIGAGISGWYVFAAIILAGIIVNWLVNLSGAPSVKLGVPYAVMARMSMGVLGARFPALVRGIVAIFWYGAQTYFASTAVALAINAAFNSPQSGEFLGMNAVSWISYVIVAVLQVALFSRGIDAITRFLNFAGPAVYVVMVVLLVVIWVRAGSEMLPAVGSIFNSDDVTGWAAVSAFVGVIGTMVAYFSAVIINFGDFSRFSKSEKSMKLGNFTGLPLSLAFFTFLALFITAGAYVVFQDGQGTPMDNPSDIVGQADSVVLSIIAAVTFLVATVGVNLVANFIPPAYDMANMAPSKISFRMGGIITAALGFIIGALWVAVIDDIGLPTFVDTLGAVLAPLYGVLVVDYYLIRRKQVNLRDTFTLDQDGPYYYRKGWNLKGLAAVGIAAVFAVLTVWVPALQDLSGFAWIIGAALGGVLYYVVMLGDGSRTKTAQSTATATAPVSSGS